MCRGAGHFRDKEFWLFDYLDAVLVGDLTELDDGKLTDPADSLNCKKVLIQTTSRIRTGLPKIDRKSPGKVKVKTLLPMHTGDVSQQTVILHCEPEKKHTKMFFWYTVYTAWPIVVKFGTYCPEEICLTEM